MAKREDMLVARRWTAKENKIVMLDLLGDLTQAEIGEIVGYSQSWVGKILKDPRAVEVREAFRKRSLEKMIETADQKLDTLVDKAVDKLDVTLSADIAATSKAKPNQDKVSLKLLEGRRLLKRGPEEGSGRGSGPLFSPEGEKRFLDMMEKANKVKDIDPFDEVPEAEYEVIEDAQD